MIGWLKIRINFSDMIWLAIHAIKKWHGPPLSSNLAKQAFKQVYLTQCQMDIDSKAFRSWIDIKTYLAVCQFSK